MIFTEYILYSLIKGDIAIRKHDIHEHSQYLTLAFRQVLGSPRISNFKHFTYIIQSVSVSEFRFKYTRLCRENAPQQMVKYLEA